MPKTTVVLGQSRHRSFFPVTLLCLIAAWTLAGCGGNSDDSSAHGRADSGAPTSPPAGAESASNTASAPDSNSNAASPASGSTAKTIERRIVYTAEVDLASENLSAAQDKLLKLVKLHNGYIAEMNVSTAAGSPREGTWKVRVPVEGFDAFMAEVAKIAELRSVHTTSQDVTAEYYDAQAHLQNKRVEETRMLQHLQTSTSKLEDILEVEHELSRVRGEIEELQGRMQLLANTAALTTVTVAIHESKEFTPVQNPSFGAQVVRTLFNSLSALRDLILGVILVFVGVLPWFAAIAVIVVPAWKIAQRYQTRPPS